MGTDYNLGQGLKGAGGGALAGAGIGSVVPGIGTGIGALVGGGLGLLGGFGSTTSGAENKNRQMLMDFYNQVGNGRTAPQAGPAAQSAYSGFRGNQSALVSRLEAMANGQGPSLARQQFEEATDRNVRSQQAIAASGRGGPLAQLTAANNTAMLGANAAQGSALARTNEQMQAIGQLGGVIAQGRGADENTNMFNAGQSNQMAIANLDARLRQMGLDDQTRLSILGQLGGAAQNQATRPGVGDQIMAGGAGLFSLAASQNAQNRVGGGAGAMTRGTPYPTSYQAPGATGLGGNDYYG